MVIRHRANRVVSSQIILVGIIIASPCNNIEGGVILNALVEGVIELEDHGPLVSHGGFACIVRGLGG